MGTLLSYELFVTRLLNTLELCKHVLCLLPVSKYIRTVLVLFVFHVKSLSPVGTTQWNCVFMCSICHDYAQHIGNRLCLVCVFVVIFVISMHTMWNKC